MPLHFIYNNTIFSYRQKILRCLINRRADKFMPIINESGVSGRITLPETIEVNIVIVRCLRQSCSHGCRKRSRYQQFLQCSHP